MATRQRVIRKVGTFGRHIRNGFVRTTTGGAWLYMLLPSQPPVRDAATWEQREQAARPILTILQALAERTPHLTLAGRKANKALYRQIHILAVSASIPFEPSRTLDPDTRVRLAVEQHDLIVHQRFTLFGVRLNSSLPKGAHRVLETVQRILQPVEYEPDEAFADDRETIGRILRSAGCTTPDETVMRRAFSWWPSGNDQEGISVLIEHGHMHTFPGHRQAELGARIHDRIVDCDSWAERIHGSYPMTVCTLGALPWQGADERTAEGVDWASRMLTLPAAGGQGAVALSVRGLVEPGELSREQIDKDKQKVLDKAIEQAQTGYKQNIKTAQDLNLASDVYGMDGRPWPTLVETHTHVAVPRIVDEPRSLGYPGAVEMNYDRQFHAWEDMQIGAEGMLEYDPSPCYWPAPILAYAGLNGRSFTGDDTGQNRDSDLPGALVGASEADAQPVYDSPFAASKRSGRCISLGLGSTGSGKQISLDTLLPVPPQPRFPKGGLVPLRDLNEGDLLYARDGGTYPILQLHPISTKDVYELELSDGQTITCGGEHQWAVWSHADRNFARQTNHRRSLERRRTVENMQKTLLDMVARTEPGDMRDAETLWDTVADTLRPLRIEGDGPTWVWNALRFTDMPSEQRHVTTMSHRPRGRFVDAAALADWLTTHRPHWSRDGIMSLRALGRPVGTRDVMDLLRVGGTSARQALRDCGLPSMEPTHGANILRTVWDTRRALAAIAERIGSRYAGDPEAGHGEQVVTTREMLDEGLLTSIGQAKWAIRATAPVEGVETDLPLDPWCLGAWLADGNAISGEITSDPSNGDLDHVIRRFEDAGFEVRRRKVAKTIGVSGLTSILRDMGVLGDKRIPEEYFHASVGQRLELVRGLLDQDGSIDGNGHIEFSQSLDHKPIVDGLVRLLRGLGVVVHEPTRCGAGYRTADGGRVRTQDRLRVSFTTTLRVFSLERKAERLPVKLRETQKWLYVKDIRPIPDTPNRCLTVGSPDHTFLIAGYVPTHNTRLALHLAGQWGRLPAPDHPGHTIPVVFWDPKPNSDDFGPFVRSRNGRFTRLDDPSSRGILDPLRCIPDTMRDMQMQMAVAMLGQITGGMHGDRNRELALTSIIGYGMRHGADCLGECVDMAYAEYAGRGPEAGTIAPLVTDIKPMLDRAVLNDPLMPLIYATEHGGAKLSVGEGLTLISAGSLNVITEKEIDSAPSAVQRWVCRMVAIGASSLVIGRDGMFVGDEAWSLLLDDFGRSVVARMGRLGRAQHYMAFLLSQKVDEFVDAGLDDFIGKVYVMAIGAKNEGSGRDSQAEAACRLAGQPLDGRMHARMMHDKYVDPDSRAPDWDSLYALFDPDTGRLLRGSIAYLSTGGGAPAIPIEVRVPDTLV